MVRRRARAKLTATLSPRTHVGVTNVDRLSLPPLVCHAMPAPPTPLARLFSAQVMAGDPSAIHRIEQALARNGGNIQATAKELGVGERTLHRWGDPEAGVPGVVAVMQQHRRGRIGRGPGKLKEEPSKPAKRARKKAS